MSKLPFMLHKELLVLLRDPVGLAFIFLMPLAVLLVVTLVQDGAFKNVTKFNVKAALVDEDGSTTSQALARGFAAAKGVQLLTEKNGQPLDRAAAREIVRQGQAQVFVVFPKGLGHNAVAAARHWAEPPSQTAAQPPAAPAPLAIETYFDPGISGPCRMLVTLALQSLAQGKEFELDMRAWGEVIPREIGKRLPPGATLPALEGAITAPAYRSGHAITVAAPANASTSTNASHAEQVPDMTQFNVPAYSVFAMFFIVIPVSTCLLRERQEGTLTRLLTMSVRPFSIIVGKLLLYLGVAVLQFSMMLAAGRWLLPACGTGAFALTAPVPTLVVLTLATGLAAVGFALAVASTATSQEQAGMVGSTSVVLLAALGGVMVPVFFMPPVMQQLSALTPLNWSVTAYQDLFTRGATLADIQGRLLLLAAFGCAGLAWSWRRLFRQA
ncbi:MAG: ABC transporter permease [Verrucomicrobia bacterium]|nr:ABC transporter permease [Verrucomicrobiota bacterium]